VRESFNPRPTSYKKLALPDRKQVLRVIHTADLFEEFAAK